MSYLSIRLARILACVATGAAMMRAGRAWRFAAVTAFLVVRSAVAAEPTVGQVTPLDAAQFSEVIDGHRGEVLLVNFWATWCRPCLKEIPELIALEDEYRDQGLRLVPVSLDEPADLERMVQPFLAKWFPGFRSYARVTPDMDSMVSVIDPAWNELLPTSYVIDREGKVRERIQGGKPRAEFQAAIMPLLGEKAINRN